MRKYFKVWSSSIDGYSCAVCARMEGAAVEIHAPFAAPGNHEIYKPPLHPGCRCSAVIVPEPLLQPRLVRVHGAFINFTDVASRSTSFEAFASGCQAAEHFLGLLAAASRAELLSVGLTNDFRAHRRALQQRRDRLFNSALRRFFRQELTNTRAGATERGRQARLHRWAGVVAASQALSPANHVYLRELVQSI